MKTLSYNETSVSGECHGRQNYSYEPAHQHTAVFSDIDTGQRVKLCPNTNPVCFCHRQPLSLCQGPISNGGGQRTGIDCPYLFVAARANVANSDLAGCVLLFNTSQGTERAVKLLQTFLKPLSIPGPVGTLLIKEGTFLLFLLRL